MYVWYWGYIVAGEFHRGPMTRDIPACLGRRYINNDIGVFASIHILSVVSSSRQKRKKEKKSSGRRGRKSYSMAATYTGPHNMWYNSPLYIENRMHWIELPRDRYLSDQEKRGFLLWMSLFNPANPHICLSPTFILRKCVNVWHVGLNNPPIIFADRSGTI